MPALPFCQPAGQTSPCSSLILQRIHQPQHLVDIAPERQVVGVRHLDHAGAVDQERAAQGDAARQQHAERTRDVLVKVGHHRELDVAEAALVDRGVLPRQVGEVRIDADRHHLGVLRSEGFEAMIVSQDFRRAHEGEVEGVEENQAIRAGQVRPEIEGRVDLVVGHHRCGGEIGGGATHQHRGTDAIAHRTGSLCLR